jgi:threonine dehydrogenase-like Zn-dependent dehydrogenase
MRATVMYAAGDVRIEDVPDSVVRLPTDAVVRITAAAICGSDLWPYESRKPEDGPARMGHEFIPALLTLADVLGTGYHAAVAGGVGPRTRVTVIGDGAVGLLAVLSARRAGAEQIILMGRHPGRTSLGREFGATDVVSARGPEGIAEVRELAGGYGSHVVIEAVGTMTAYQEALEIARPGGVISRVGVPQYDDAPVGSRLFRHNIRLAGGPAPVRAYIQELLPDILNGTIAPGRVFDVSTGLDGVPAGYQDMADRTALKVLIRP